MLEMGAQTLKPRKEILSITETTHRNITWGVIKRTHTF